jgi:hypothetical protein
MSFDPITAGIDLVGSLANKFFPDADEKMKTQATQALVEMQSQYQIQLEQIKVNAVEAANPSWKVAGWRPAVGWICAFALGYSAIIEPFARFIAVVFFQYAGAFPVIDSTITMQVLFGLLGLGAYRSFDKLKGTSK